jgi:hypothetical protein
MVICRVFITIYDKFDIDICWPENKNYQNNGDKKALHYIQAALITSGKMWNTAEWSNIPPLSTTLTKTPINEKGSYTFNCKQRIADMPLNIGKLKIWPYFCYPTDGNNNEEIKKDGKPITFEISLTQGIQAGPFNLNVNTFFHNSLDKNQLCLKEVSCTSTLKELKNMIIEKIEDLDKDTTYTWTPWTVNLFNERYSRLCDDISNEDNVKLRDCLKHGMTINVVINRISLDGFPKIDDIRWPPTAASKSITAGGGTGDEVIYFVSAGFQGIQGYAAAYAGSITAYAGSIGLDTNSYTGLPQ